jgi:DNA polymerase-3 subunit gamma/tau
VADAEQLFDAVDAVVARDPAHALRAANRLAESGRDPGQVLRDLEIHGRELLTVQVLGEVPPELRVTPDRDARLAAQAQALAKTDAVRLLDLVSAALAATADGAQARIQLELVLIKAAAPEVDPTTSALLARIERLEGGAAPVRAVQTAPPPPAQAAPAPAAPAQATQAPPVEAAPAPAAPAQATPAPPVEAAPAPEPALPAAALGLDAATRVWPAVVEQVNQSNAMLAHALANTRPVAVTERELVVAFPTGADFLKRKADQEDHRRMAADALRTLSGQALALRYELRDLETPDAPALSGEELVQRFIEEFDAEELPQQEGEAQ